MDLQYTTLVRSGTCATDRGGISTSTLIFEMHSSYHVDWLHHQRWGLQLHHDTQYMYPIPVVLSVLDQSLHVGWENPKRPPVRGSGHWHMRIRTTSSSFQRCLQLRYEVNRFEYLEMGGDCKWSPILNTHYKGNEA